MHAIAAPSTLSLNTHMLLNRSGRGASLLQNFSASQHPSNQHGKPRSQFSPGPKEGYAIALVFVKATSNPIPKDTATKGLHDLRIRLANLRSG